jgi:hypothetical protein
MSVPKAADTSSIECVKDPNAGLGAGEVCIDTGIRNQSLFSFANWGGRRYKADDFGFPEMIALYGESVICAKVGQRKCDVTPKARLMRAVIDNMLQNGRCEGLSALGALYMNSRGPAPQSFKADDIQTLTPAVDEFANVIDYWWATQFLSDVIDQSKSTRKSGVKKVLEQIIAGLKEKSGITVGIYAEEGAHSVLPVAVTRSDENSYIAHVWDSNNPRSLGRLQFDLQKEQWTYLGGRLNTGSAAKKWTGGNGTIDAVALSARKGKPLLDVGKSEKGNATITATSSSAQSLSLELQSGDGKKLLATTTGVTGAIPGVEVTPIRNGDINQILVTLPESLQDFTAKLTTSAMSKNVDSGSTQLTVDSGEERAISASIPPGLGTSSATVKAVLQSQSSQRFEATSPQSISIQASTETAVLNVPIEARETIAIASSNSKEVDSVISITPVNGDAQRTTIARPVNGETQEVVVARDTEGVLVPILNSLSAVPVNRAELTALTSSTSSVSARSTTGSRAVTISPDAENVKMQSFNGAITDTSASITTRITSEVDVELWTEYGPADNWSAVEKTTRQKVASGLENNVKSSLVKLTPGTVYRYRTAVDVDGFTVFSSYSTFETTGDAPEENPGGSVDPDIRIAASLVAVTSTGGVIASKITSAATSKVWIEYFLESNSSFVQKTAEQTVLKGADVQLVSVLNGLTMGQAYKYRVVIRSRNSLGYSPLYDLKTGSSVATGRLPTSSLGAIFSFVVGEITETTASLSIRISSTYEGRAQAEFSSTNLNESTKSTTVSFAAGKDVSATIPLAGLIAGTKYSVRLLVNSNGSTQFGTYQTFETKPIETKPPEVPAVVSDQVSAPVVIQSLLREDSASVTASITARSEGIVYFEYSIANNSALLYKSAETKVSSTTNSVGPVSLEAPLLRAGNPYRVRTVLSTGNQILSSPYTTFTTLGQMDVTRYQASTPNLRRNNTGADVSWSIPAVDVPSSVVFKVLQGSTTLCSTSGTSFDCQAALSFGSHSLVVATFFNDVEIARSGASTITISGTPVISSFSLLSASSTSLVFTYSFNPQGETVQYGVQVNGVAPSLGGTTSTALNGATHQVSGLTPTTTYTARFILVSGSIVTASDWITVSTQ